jgi:hypothetical protein
MFELEVAAFDKAENWVEHKANLYVGDISDKDIAKLLSFLPP